MIDELKIYLSQNTCPYKNLAAEEYLTMHAKDGQMILYLWQNEHTVVIGRNQNAWRECKIAELQDSGGCVARRLSGGGAVYHDMGNLNFTFCVKRKDYDVDKQLSVIVQAVKSLGADAQKTGRNDITIDGRKFSGNAFYKSGEYCYHHGTLLLNADTASMTKYLNVDREKLRTKGVQSVKARVVNLASYIPELTAEMMKEKLIKAAEQVYGCRAQMMHDTELDNTFILSAERKFSGWDWIFGPKIPFTHSVKKRFAWGGIEFCFNVDSGVVKQIDIYSDMMEQDAALRLKQNLSGCKYEKQELLLKAGHSLVLDVPGQVRKDILQLLDDEL